MPRKTITRSKKSHKKKIIQQNKPLRTTIPGKAIKEMFHKRIIKEIAKANGFIQRQRKLDAYEFFLSLTFGSVKTDHLTLSVMIENLSNTISRVGLHHRFNKRTCDFLWGIYSHMFDIINKNQTDSMNIKVCHQFNHIHVVDSSSWKVPEGLKEIFAGYNIAGCKTQLVIDYKTGMIQHLDITQETYNDQKYSKNIADFVKENDLSIFDLAYAVPASLKTIDEQGAFFLCRFNAGCMHVYVKKDQGYTQFGILDILTKLTDHQTINEISCYVGNKDNMTQARLIAIRVPEEVANRRCQKLRRNSQKQGRTPKKQTLELCHWTLLITNIPKEKDLNIREIITLYSIRWTIELFFKQLKSVLKIHKTDVKNNPHRLECEVLGRCIVAMFIAYCYSTARNHLWRMRECEISFEKTVKYFKRNVAPLLNYLLTSIQRAVSFVEQMILKIIDTCQKYRQHSRKNSLDLLQEKSIYPNLKHNKISSTKFVAMFA